LKREAAAAWQRFTALVEALPSDQAMPPMAIGTRAISNYDRGRRAMKASKESVDYSRGMADSHCGKSFKDDTGYCRHFIPPSSPANDGSCERVAGTINAAWRRFVTCMETLSPEQAFLFW
jgi:hypothetical protein